MTQQLNLDGMGGAGRIVPTNLQEEMQRSYLEYAMSVIVGRALPDVRDGLKPVHRRILYAMHELGLTPDRPFRKCARVVGDVLGKYHPHGDQAVYDALVRMVQEFSSRYPLVAGHGNFGSVDNDPAAAMRYTECRLAPIANSALLSDISEDIVDFIPNFDGSQAEPSVLPARLPLLLVNGSAGIAVGMATNVPPHNLGELIDGLLVLIERPDLSPDELMQHIPAPDFPTGGEILDGDGIRDAYVEGRGAITVRGVAQFEEIQPGKGKHRRTAIIVTEFPFQVNKAAWIEKVADLVNEGRLNGISDLRDESDRTGIRVVVELRREANPAQVLQQLYRLTPLQTTFGAILLALVEGRPQQLGLKALLQHFLDHREITLTRLFRSELEKVRHKAEEVAGMLLALNDLDRVIEVLRQARDGSTAKVQLQEVLGCSATQADTILAMPLRRLTGLERERLQQDYDALQARILELEGLLQERRKLLNHLKKELRDLKKHYADPRRTRIKTQADLQAEAMQGSDPVEVEEAPALLQFTRKGYVRRILPTARRGRPGREARDGEDPVLQTALARPSQEVLALTASGKGFTVPVRDIPAGQGRGTPLVTLLSPQETVVATFVLDPALVEEHHLILLSQQGRLKRVLLREFTRLTSRGSMAMRLKEDDALIWACLCSASQPASVLIATSGGRVLRLALNEEQVPLMGRTAMGNAALRLHRRETIVGLVGSEPETVVLATRLGYAKRLSLSEIPLMERGSVGIQAMQFQHKADALVGALAIPAGSELGLSTSSGFLRIVADIPQQNRASKGILLVTLAPEETVTSLHRLDPELGA